MRESILMKTRPNARCWLRLSKNPGLGRFLVSAGSMSGLFTPAFGRAVAGLVLLGTLFLVLAHRSGGDRYRVWYGGEFSQAFQVLDSGRHQELVPCPGQTAWPEPCEPEFPAVELSGHKRCSSWPKVSPGLVLRLAGVCARLAIYNAATAWSWIFASSAPEGPPMGPESAGGFHKYTNIYSKLRFVKTCL